MMKYRFGSSGRPSPIHVSSASGAPHRKFGKRIALSLALFSVPKVRYPRLALGNVTPHCNLKSPRLKISMTRALSVSDQTRFHKAGHQVEDQIFEVVLAPHRLPQGELRIELFAPLAGQLRLQIPDDGVEVGLTEGVSEPGRRVDHVVLAPGLQAVQNVGPGGHGTEELDDVGRGHVASPVTSARSSASVCRDTQHSTRQSRWNLPHIPRQSRLLPANAPPS